MAKVNLEICTGTSCHLMGSYDLYHVVENLQKKYGELLEVSVLSCLGKCGQGPNIRFEGIIYNQVTPEQLKKLVRQALKNEV